MNSIPTFSLRTMFYIVTAAAVVGFLLSNRAMGKLWGAGIAAALLAALFLTLVHGFVFSMLHLLSRSGSPRKKVEKAGKASLVLLSLLAMSSSGQAQEVAPSKQAFAVGKMFPAPGAPNKSGIAMEATTSNPEASGYRKSSFFFSFAKPTPPGMTLEIILNIKSWYYRDGGYRTSKAFIVPANSRQFQCAMLALNYESGCQASVEVRRDGRKVDELCGMISPGVFNNFYDAAPRILFLADRYPDFTRLSELVTMDGVQNPNSSQNSREMVFPDGYAASDPEAAGRPLNEANQMIKVSELVNRVRLADAPETWLEYCSANIICVSLDDLLLLQKTRKNAFTALRQWVWAGGNLWVTNGEQGAPSKLAIDTLFDHALETTNEESAADERGFERELGKDWSWQEFVDKPSSLRVLPLGDNISLELDASCNWIKSNPFNQTFFRNFGTLQDPQGASTPPEGWNAFTQGTYMTNNLGNVVYATANANTAAQAYTAAPSPPADSDPAMDSSADEPDAGDPNTGTESPDTETDAPEAKTEDPEVGTAITGVEQATNNSDADTSEAAAATESGDQGMDEEKDAPAAEVVTTAETEETKAAADVQNSAANETQTKGLSEAETEAEEEASIENATSAMGAATESPKPNSLSNEGDASDNKILYASRRCGLGQIMLIYGNPYPGTHADWLRLVVDSSHSNSVTKLGISAVKPCPDFWSFMVPGVGLVPVNAFRVLITLFAIVIGPVNYWLLKRMHRIQLMVITVPATAALVTAALFAYALIADGLETRVRSKSVTLINQKTGDATCWSRTTYYAGVSPWSGLKFSKDTAVYPIQSRGRTSNEVTPTLDMTWEGDQQHFSSRWLPARNPTQLLSIRSRTTSAKVSINEQPNQLAFGNGLGTHIQEILAINTQGQFHVAEDIATGALKTGKMTRYGEAIGRLERWLKLLEPPPEFDTAVLTSSPNSFMGQFSGRYNYYYNRADPNWSSSLLEDATSQMTNRRSLGWGKGTYFALVDRSPEYEAGLEDAKEAGMLHIIIGRYANP